MSEPGGLSWKLSHSIFNGTLAQLQCHGLGLLAIV